MLKTRLSQSRNSPGGGVKCVVLMHRITTRLVAIHNYAQYHSLTGRQLSLMDSVNDSTARLSCGPIEMPLDRNRIATQLTLGASIYFPTNCFAKEHQQRADCIGSDARQISRQ